MQARRVVIGVVALAAVAVAVLVGVGTYYCSRITAAVEQSNSRAVIPPKTSPVEPLQALNVLLLGVDSGRLMDAYRERSGLADTIMLFIFRPEAKAIYQVSIPRDSRVVIPGKGTHKINSAYAYGGALLCQETVEDLLDLEIDRVFVINYELFVRLVDLVGGVALDVEPDINNRFNIGEPIPTGFTRLTGEEAFRYVHARDSDVERVQRQQKFLRALYREVRQQGAFTKVVGYLINHPEQLATNFTLEELMRLARSEDEYEEHTLHTYFLEGEGRYIDGLSYWILDESRLELVKKTFQKRLYAGSWRPLAGSLP